MKAFAIVIITILSTEAIAAEKTQYHLFNPTPDSEKRGFTTERPTKSFSAYTIDAGHLQIESELMNFSMNEQNNQEDRLLKLMQANLRLGLLHNLEAQLEFQPYLERTVRVEVPPQEQFDGFGSTFFRVKYNLHGNDETTFAIAFMPGVKFATEDEELRSHEKVEGQFAIPASWQINNLWLLVGNLRINNINDDPDLDWQTNYETSLALSRTLDDFLTGYIEIYNSYAVNPELTNDTTLNFALEYQLNPMTKLDVGTFQGISPEATNEEYFVGASVRF